MTNNADITSMSMLLRLDNRLVDSGVTTSTALQEPGGSVTTESAKAAGHVPR